jgi:hypothetical protein
MRPLPLSAELLAHAWDYLMCLPPFDRLNMPPSDDVRLRVTKSSKYFGQYYTVASSHRIDISSKLVRTHIVLLATLAHEAIHLHLNEVGGCDDHGPNFMSFADEVCLLQGFDRLTF